MEINSTLTPRGERAWASGFAQYIFYRREGKSPSARYKCYCTACREEYYADFAEMCPEGYTRKHGDYVICPHCGAPAYLHAEGRGRGKLSTRQGVVFFRAIDNNTVVALAYDAYIDYPTRDPVTTKYLSKQYILTPGKNTIIASLEMLPRVLKTQISEPFASGFFGPRDYIVLNLAETCKTTFLKYLSLDYYRRAVPRVVNLATNNYWPTSEKLMSYICFYALHPCAEMMLKRDLGKLVTTAVLSRKEYRRLINWDGKTPEQVFKNLSKKEINDLCKMPDKNYIFQVLKAKKELQKSNIQIEIRDIIGLFTICGGTVYLALEMLKRGISLIKIENYVNKQVAKYPYEISENRKRHEIMIAWHDYLDECRDLHYDLSATAILFPRDLLQAHAQTTALHTAMVNAANEKKLQARIKDLRKKYSFEYKGLKIVVPQSMQEIIDEGQALQHCVGRYADKHAAGITTILFLRRKNEPEKPFYTIEISQRKAGNKLVSTIQQCHGYENDIKFEKPPEVKEFEKKFEKFLKNPTAPKRGRKKVKKNDKMSVL